MLTSLFPAKTIAFGGIITAVEDSAPPEKKGVNHLRPIMKGCLLSHDQVALDIQPPC